MKTELPNFQDMDPGEKRRLAYIEGREDLFPTKVLEISGANSAETISDGKGKRIVVVSRDPGSANALVPAVDLLVKEGNKITAIVDGRAEQILRERFKIKDITPEGSIFRVVDMIGSPDAFLIDRSEEPGIEMFSTATFPEIPSVLLEDYPGSCLGYLKRLKESNLPYPKKICVMDEEAKGIIIENFPDLRDSIEVTGQPAFDLYAHEDAKEISEETRKKLNIGPKEKLITFMSSIDPIELIEDFAEKLAGVGKSSKFKFTFRIHPRDNRPLEELFKNRGIDYVSTMGKVTTDQIGAASDVICMGGGSTTMFPAIYRGIPVVSINDPKYLKPNEDLIIPPPVKLGAVVGLDNVEDATGCMEKLLDPESKEYQQLKNNMKKYYPNDGKNAQRVVRVIEGVLND